MLKNYKLIIEYDGTGYHGWQRQKAERTIQQEIEQALADAKSRPINKAVVILQALFVRFCKHPDDFIKQMNQSLQGASRLGDLLLEARLLRDLIIYKKNRDIPRESEVARLNTILEELAPRAVGMPFENAWQNYYKDMKAFGNA